MKTSKQTCDCGSGGGGGGGGDLRPCVIFVEFSILAD